MAISPKVLDDKFQKEVDSLEMEIDKILLGKKLTTSKIVTIQIPQLMFYTHYQAIKERYIKAGWSDLTWKSDQRDGDYLEFKA